MTLWDYLEIVIFFTTFSSFLMSISSRGQEKGAGKVDSDGLTMSLEEIKSRKELRLDHT